MMASYRRSTDHDAWKGLIPILWEKMLDNALEVTIFVLLTFACLWVIGG